MDQAIALAELVIAANQLRDQQRDRPETLAIPASACPAVLRVCAALDKLERIRYGTNDPAAVLAKAREHISDAGIVLGDVVSDRR